jgi:hypothetical protein
MYQFVVEDINGRPQISPDVGNEEPAGQVGIDPGETLNITLQLNYKSFNVGPVSINPKQEIRDAVGTTSNPFTQQLATVQLLEGITVGEGY